MRAEKTIKIMYQPTAEQLKAEKELNKAGFKFGNWIQFDELGNPDQGCMVMIKKTKFGREYREISPDGSIN